MNVLLWVLQVLAALVYGASGIMKVFMFDKVSEGAQSFGAQVARTLHARRSTRTRGAGFPN